MSETKDSQGERQVPPAWIFHLVFVALLVATVVSYCASTVDLGREANVAVGLVIAVVQAALVCGFFMHLHWERSFNGVILVAALGFTALFISMATLDSAENAWRKDPAYAEEKMEQARETLGITYGNSAGSEGTDQGSTGSPNSDGARIAQRAAKQFGTLPKEVAPRGYAITDAMANLGRQLYWETRISKSGTISCNSCHGLDTFGQDGLATSPGHDGTRGTRNSPTTFNAALNTAGQFWDARADTLEQQATMAITNPVEMGMENGDAVVAVLGAIPGYVDGFKAAFPGEEDALTFVNVGKALGAFERRLLTPSRFDAFTNGEHGLLNAQELRGFEVFVDFGCATCHTTNNFGGGQIEKMGKAEFYPGEDQGVFEDTGKERDRQMFKVPTLRNVTETGPWFHDGSLTDLGLATRLMAKHELGKTISDEQIADIVAFLGTLTGELDASLKAKPTLP